MKSFFQLFKANLKIIYRNQNGLFWTIVLPTGIYIALALLPIPNFAKGNLAYSDYVLPGIVAYTIMQGGIYGLSYWMVDMRSKGVIKRFLVTPIKTRELVFSLISARLVVSILQVILLTFLGVIFFKVNFAGNILSILFLTILGGGIFLLLGLLISNYANSYESAAPITAVIGMPLAFLGNLFFPLSALPEALQKVGKILPITFLANGLRTSYLEPFNLSSIAGDFLALSIWLLIMLFITIRLFKLKE